MIIKCNRNVNKRVAQMSCFIPGVLHKSKFFLNVKLNVRSMPDSSTCMILKLLVRSNTIIIDRQHSTSKAQGGANKMSDWALAGTPSFVDLSMLFFKFFCSIMCLTALNWKNRVSWHEGVFALFSLCGWSEDNDNSGSAMIVATVPTIEHVWQILDFPLPVTHASNRDG